MNIRLIAAMCLMTTMMATALAADWKYYETKPFGFSMLVPTGVTVREREWGDGWGGLYAEFEGVKLYGRAKLGPRESDDDIEKYALRIIGIPAYAWTKIDSGTNARGFQRYRTFRAMDGSKCVGMKTLNTLRIESSGSKLVQ